MKEQVTRTSFRFDQRGRSQSNYFAMCRRTNKILQNSLSMSSRKMAGLFPPSSSVVLFRLLSPAAFMISCPTCQHSQLSWSAAPPVNVVTLIMSDPTNCPMSTQTLMICPACKHSHLCDPFCLSHVGYTQLCEIWPVYLHYFFFKIKNIKIWKISNNRKSTPIPKPIALPQQHNAISTNGTLSLLPFAHLLHQTSVKLS